jgi:hypothetical protein
MASGVPGQLAKWVTPTFQSSSVISESATNRVGVGLPDPTGGGVVDSVFTIKNLDNNTGFAVLNQSQQRRFALNTLATGGWSLYDGGSNTWNRGLTQVNGNVGIGTTTPAASLDVRGIAGLSAPTVASFATGSGVLLPAVSATVDSFVTNVDSAAIFGRATGTGGHAAGFATGPNHNVSAVRIDQAGTGVALEVGQFGPNPNTDIVVFRGAGAGIVGRIDKTGRSFFTNGGEFGGTVYATGNVGINVSAPTARLEVQASPDVFAPPAGWFKATSGTVATAVLGQVDTPFANETGAAIRGVSLGVSGYAGFFEARAGNFSDVVHIRQAGTGPGLTVDHTGSSGDIAWFQSASGNVARIDKTGKGFFNGGTQTGGADVAESFDVEGNVHAYEPGDVLEISADHDRHLARSSAANSTRVVGVYATKPGVLLTDRAIDADHADRVPLGVLGVIPTKVSTENGAIRRGDLLVSAATSGHAMKADPHPPAGAIIGKALADFPGPGTGLIEVFVSVR